jgi:two-component system nitrogen regulation response regulator NtrX
MKRRIIVVDDEEQIRFLVKSVLEMEGCEVTEAEDASGLRNCFTGPAPDVVILDLNLPDGNGLALLPEVKKTWPSVKVIILTGYGTVEAAEAAYKVDEVYFQNKPFDAEMMKALVELALARKAPAQMTGPKSVTDRVT